MRSILTCFTTSSKETFGSLLCRPDFTSPFRLMVGRERFRRESSSLYCSFGLNRSVWSPTPSLKLMCCKVSTWALTKDIWEERRGEEEGREEGEERRERRRGGRRERRGGREGEEGKGRRGAGKEEGREGEETRIGTRSGTDSPLVTFPETWMGGPRLGPT